MGPVTDFCPLPKIAPYSRWPPWSKMISRVPRIRTKREIPCNMKYKQDLMVVTELIFILLSFLDHLSVSLIFLYFFCDSKIYSKHFGILLLIFEQKYNFSQLFSK